MADAPQPSGSSVPDPYFEPIGPDLAPLGPMPAGLPGVLAGGVDDEGGTPGGPELRTVVRAAAVAWWGSLVSFRCWAVPAGAVCATWAVAAGLAWVSAESGQDPSGSGPAPLLTYVLASALLPGVAALMGIHWGMARRVAPAPAGGDGSGLLATVLATALRGLVFGVLVLASLLLQAAIAGGPGAVALIATGLSAVEVAVFGGMGAAVAGLVRHPVLAMVAGWALGLFLVAGTVIAGALLLPAVRSDEPLTVALNVERAADGTPTAYECSRIPAGTAEVYRTERIMWLPAASPVVVLVMLAGDAGPGREMLGWPATEFQAAADGTAVPCVNGEPRSKDSPRMPLATAGFLLQAGVAGALVGAAHAAATRRRPSA